jgi:hypothetical protein
LPWLEGNPQNLEDDMEAKLASFHDSQVGYEWAWEFGFKDALTILNGEEAEKLFGGAEVPAFGDGGNSKAAAGAPGSAAVRASTAAGANPLPRLQRGSDIEIADCVAQVLRQDRGEVIFSEGHFWYYDGSHWRPIEDPELRCVVHRYDGAMYPSPSRPMPVKLNKARVDSILNEMSAMLARPDFFNDAPIGINCASGFIAFASDGTPSVQPHQPEHRCRHVLSAAFMKDLEKIDTEQLFQTCLVCGFLFGRLLEGIFREEDPDALEKRQLLAEIAGAAALGYRSKSWEPKAVIFEGKTAENGKSQVLDLFRGLLPSDAVTSIPAAKMGDERFLVGLVAKHLNASDELSGADAIASEVFKAVVTGEPVTGRDVYRSAVNFRSVAQNVFAANTLPTFKGGIDRGVQRRLLVVNFNRTIPRMSAWRTSGCV